MNNINLFLFIINILMSFGIILSSILTPYILRKNILFGVSIPNDAKKLPQTKTIRNSYTFKNLSILVFSIATAILIHYLAPRFNLLFLLYMPIFYMPVSFLFYRSAWKSALSLKKEQNWKTENKVYIDTKLSSKQERKLQIPWIWYIISTIIVTITLIYSLYVYPSIPDTIITHWNMNGIADGSVDKNIFSVVMLPLFAIPFSVFMAFMGHLYIKTKLSVDTDNVKTSFKQKEKFRKIWQHFSGYTSLLLTLLFCFIQLFSIQIIDFNSSNFEIIIIAFLLLISIPAIILPIYTGQGGCRLKVKSDEFSNTNQNKSSSKNQKTLNNKNDDYLWKWGMFYYNPNDPSVFVESRFGTNIEFNYARKGVKIFVFSTLLILIPIYIIVTILAFKGI